MQYESYKYCTIFDGNAHDFFNNNTFITNVQGYLKQRAVFSIKNGSLIIYLIMKLFFDKIYFIGYFCKTSEHFEYSAISTF